MSHLRDEWASVEKGLAEADRVAAVAQERDDVVLAEVAREARAAAGRRAWASGCSTWEHLRG